MNNPAAQSLTASLSLATVALLAVGVGGGLIYQHRVSAEHAAVLSRQAESDSRPATRSVRVDENGIERHTLCSGGGWCVTDRVPPVDWSSPEQKVVRKAKGLDHSMPTIDVTAVCRSVAAVRPEDLSDEPADVVSLVEGCKRLVEALPQ